MSDFFPLPSRNNLLRQLNDADRALLDPFLTEVTLNVGEVLMDALKPFSHVYFVTDGVVSVIANSEDGPTAEVGIYGREGMGSSAFALGSDRCPHMHIVQIPGNAWRIEINDLADGLRHSSALSSLLLRYAHVFNVQIAYTAVANGRYLLEQRLARWLLMCQDRIENTEIPLTHQFLATMLSVRRASVTDAIHILEGQKIIKTERGRIEILDRKALIEKAGNSYGPPESEYQRLIGTSPAP